MRIMWFSNTPLAGTGYGVQTAEVAPRIKADGHDVAIACNWGHFAAVLDWNGIPLYPAGKDRYSNDIARAHADAFGADWTITLYDVWPLVRQGFPDKVASWVPIDHSPVPPEVAAWCKTVRPIAMSRFGQRELRGVGIDSAYIPHSVNTAVFKPTESPVRKSMGVPDDAYLVMIAAANQGISPPRKAWGEMFGALGRFMREHSDVWLYVHTDRTQSPPNGVDLGILAQMTGLPIERILWTDPYKMQTGQIRQQHLAAVYSSADVLLATSMGEGFGVPVIEAQACGLPVIVSDFTAQPELCESGWLVEGQKWYDPTQHATAFYLPFIDSIVGRLEEAYAARGDNGLRERAVAFAAAYDTDKVYDQFWRPFLKELEADIDKPAPVPVDTLSRKERRAAERAARKKGKAA